MADVINIANSESPTLSVLTSTQQRDPFVYSVRSNVGSVAKSVVEVKPSNGTASFGSESHFNIPRHGIMVDAYIKLRITCGDGSNVTKFCSALGLHCCKRVDLQTAGNVIESQFPEVAQLYMNSLPHKQRSMYQNAVVYGASDTVEGKTASHTFTCYCPLFMSFSLRSQNALDTRFLEDLQVVASMQNVAYIHNLAGGSTAPSLASDGCRLVCVFFSPREEDNKKYQSSNFSVERPLTMLYRNVFQETPYEVVNPGAVVEQTHWI